MELQTLYLTRETYGVNEGRFTGTASFKNRFGQITLNLDPEVSDNILQLVADSLVASGRTIGQELTSDCIASAPALLQPQAE